MALSHAGAGPLEQMLRLTPDRRTTVVIQCFGVFLELLAHKRGEANQPVARSARFFSRLWQRALERVRRTARVYLSPGCLGSLRVAAEVLFECATVGWLRRGWPDHRDTTTTRNPLLGVWRGIASTGLSARGHVPCSIRSAAMTARKVPPFVSTAGAWKRSPFGAG